MAPARGPMADSTLVITRAELIATGRTSLPEALQALLPSLNYPRPSGADWTDHLRPATVRGLGSDQLLVLVNGERFPRAPLVHLHPTVGRGEVAPDLDAIPLATVSRVELSRGAPDPGWGPEGLAGVINIVIDADLPRELVSRLGVFGSGGVRVSNGAAWRHSWPGGATLQVAGEYRVRGATNHARPDPRDQFFPGDPRNEDPELRTRVRDRLGDPERRDGAVWLRGRLPAGGVALGATVGLSRRRSESAALWRRPLEDGTVRSLYPGGFLPLLAGESRGAVVQLDATGRVAGWDWKAGASYGSSRLIMKVENTANASLGPISPTRFHSGRLGSADLLARAELGREFAVRPVRVSLRAGAEARSEAYRTEPGERDSYRYGGVPIQDGPRAGSVAPLGAQGFPGFMPGDSGRLRRGTYAGYGAVRLTPAARLQLTAAGRVDTDLGEEFGTRATGSVAGSWSPGEGVTLRGHLGTGYRLPPLAQLRFSRTLVPVTGEVGLFDLLVPPSHPVAVSMGAVPLRPERSSGRGAGLDLSGRRFTFSADYFRIAIRDRILLTGKFTGPAVRFYLESQGHDGIGTVQYFVNAGTIQSEGVELRAGYEGSLGGLTLGLAAGYDHHRVEVTRVDSATGFARQFQSTFFSPAERARIISGQPGDNFTGSARLARGAWSVRLALQRYGALLDYGPSPDGTMSQRLGARWLGDLAVAYSPGPRVTLTAGAENFLGARPDRMTLGAADLAGNSYYGVFPYSSLSPFGFNGRFFYAGAEWRYAAR